MTIRECPIDLDERNGITRVDAEAACPGCGENDMDLLVWDEAEYVTCQSCGTVYDPSEVA